MTGKLRAMSIDGVQNSNWIVTEYVQTHTCTTDDVQAGCSTIGNRIVGDIIKGKFLDSNKIIKLRDIVSDIQSEYGTVNASRLFHPISRNRSVCPKPHISSISVVCAPTIGRVLHLS